MPSSGVWVHSCVACHLPAVVGRGPGSSATSTATKAGAAALHLSGGVTTLSYMRDPAELLAISDRMNEGLRAALGASPRVLFVCSGNMIRSAFAELYARHLRLPRQVASCGTTYFNDRLHPRTRAALLARGVSLELIEPFRPTHLSDLARPAPARTLALGMTRDHVDALEAQPALADRSHLLGDARGGDEISDPLFDERYEECFDELTRCVEALVAALQRAP